MRTVCDAKKETTPLHPRAPQRGARRGSGGGGSIAVTVAVHVRTRAVSLSSQTCAATAGVAHVRRRRRGAYFLDFAKVYLRFFCTLSPIALHGGVWALLLGGGWSRWQRRI